MDGCDYRNRAGGAVQMRVTSIEEYRDQLLFILAAKAEDTELRSQTVQVLEDLCLVLGYNLPIVILPQHFYHHDEHVTGRGQARLCKCGALWPCPSDSDLIVDPGPTKDLK